MLFSIFLLSLGVICEYHFSIYQRVQRIAAYLWKQICAFFLLVAQLLTRLLKWLGECLSTLIEILSWFLFWLATLFPWWLWAILFALIAIIVGLIFGMYLLAALLVCMILIICILGGLWTILTGGILALLATIVALSIPTCSTQNPVPAPIPTVVQKKEKALESPKELSTPQVSMISIQPGDGCIRATARGAHPMSLKECIIWTREQGLDVHKVRGFIHAPTLYTTDAMEHKDGRWILHRSHK